MQQDKIADMTQVLGLAMESSEPTLSSTFLLVKPKDATKDLQLDMPLIANKNQVLIDQLPAMPIYALIR